MFLSASNADVAKAKQENASRARRSIRNGTKPQNKTLQSSPGSVKTGPSPGAAMPPSRKPGFLNLPVVVPAESSSITRYMAPAELIDSPRAWESELYYFGDAATDEEAAAMQSTASTSATPPAPNSSWLDTLTTLVSKAGTAYLDYESQKKFNDINAQRLKSGLPPLSPDQYTASKAPSATVAVGLAPKTQKIINYALIGGGILALIFMVPRFLPSHRRR